MQDLHVDNPGKKGGNDAWRGFGRTNLHIWNMCFALFGIQIVWALQNANTTRKFQTLGADRSEEHTSELQSLMRISYAVFCLKKKKNNKRSTVSDSIVQTQQNATKMTYSSTV